MNIELNTHIQKHTDHSRYTFHIQDDWNRVLDMVRAAVQDPKNIRPSYRDSKLVNLPTDEFRITHRTLREGDILFGGFDPRTPGEEPRIWLRSLNQDGSRAAHRPKRVEAVLYPHAMLAENNEQSTDADWELITFLGYPTEEPEPMDPWTMCYNHFELPGGTATGWSDAEFTAELRKSFSYWRDKA